MKENVVFTYSDVAIDVEAQVIGHVPERLVECCLLVTLSKSTLVFSHAC